jgi:predicted amino acid-binding ACT domain protein
MVTKIGKLLDHTGITSSKYYVVHETKFLITNISQTVAFNFRVVKCIAYCMFII